MPTEQFDVHLRQFFAYTALARADRVTEAGVAFTYSTFDLYLSTFAEGMDLLRSVGEQESNPELLRYAQTFERFATTGPPGVDTRIAGLVAAAFYWLAGYGANSLVLARSQSTRETASGKWSRSQNLDSLSGLLTAFLKRSVFGSDASGADVAHRLRRYLTTGSLEELQRARTRVADMRSKYFSEANADEVVAGILLDATLTRLSRVSLWGSIANRSSCPIGAWRRYAQWQANSRTPVVDLWPSQRTAIKKGLLNGISSVVLKMPTSAGKTKMTELAFVNDLATDDRRCLYLAPFRALVSDVETSIGPTLAEQGYSVASLYGSSDANELELELSESARVVIATPEKMSAVLKLGEGVLADFGTIVLDEGHLLGSQSRGVAYELQLAALRRDVLSATEGGEHPTRIIFLSAVLPNADEIAYWLAGSADAVASDSWHPTSMRIGEVTWGDARFARINYYPLAGEPRNAGFFVPRVLEMDEWTVPSPTGGGRRRTLRFPDKKSNASVAAGLALQSVRNGPVLVFAQRPKWAESIASAIVDRAEMDRPIETNLISSQNRAGVRDLAEFIANRLGVASLIARSVAHGVGIHHAKVPQSIRLVIEDAFRDGTLRLLVATSTVAQGVNFPAKTVLLHSLPMGDAPVRDFWNLAGRAGRAMRETEGELLILRTGTLRRSRLAEFLDRRRIEPAQSQILAFVEEILRRSEAINDETINAFLGSEEGEPWRKAISAIDTDLLERMVEDTEGADDGVAARIAESLLGTQQARGFETLPPDAAVDQRVIAIAELMLNRTRAVRSEVPVAAARKRFARTTLSATDAIALDANVPQLREYLLGQPEISRDAVEQVVRVACTAPELSDEEPRRLFRMAYAWLETGRYDAVMRASEGWLGDLDEAITFVEEVLSYRLNWMLNGLVRLLEDRGTEGERVSREGGPEEGRGSALAELPEWLKLLPQYLRYGVLTRELLWIMTLGFHDRAYAEFLLDRYQVDRNEVPNRFRDVVRWLLEREADLQERTNSGWPRYWGRVLKEIVARYRNLYPAVQGQGIAR